MDTENGGEGSFALQLTENLHASPKLTVGDIRMIAQNKFGLRTTNPASLEMEKNNGVKVGDFLVLHDVSHLLAIDEPKFSAAHPAGATNPDLEDLKYILIQKGFTEQDSPVAEYLTGLDELPKKYAVALSRFFTKQAIPALKVSAEISGEMQLGEYIATLPELTPGLLLVRDTNPKVLAYDHEQYGGFGKRGRSVILPDQMIGMERGITDAEQQLFAQRYKRYLDLPAGQELRHSGLHAQRLFEHVDRDVVRLLTDKTIRMAQKSSPHTA